MIGGTGDAATVDVTSYNCRGCWLKVGEEIITSGHGGVYPYGIPVGKGSGFYDGIYHINPHVRVEDVGFVQVVDYGLNGVIDP